MAFKPKYKQAPFSNGVRKLELSASTIAQTIISRLRVVDLLGEIQPKNLQLWQDYCKEQKLGKKAQVQYNRLNNRPDDLQIPPIDFKPMIKRVFDDTFANYQNEKVFLAFIESKGYVARKSSGAEDYHHKVDVVATKNDKLFFFQIKRANGQYMKGDQKEKLMRPLAKYAKSQGATPYLITRVGKTGDGTEIGKERSDDRSQAARTR